jgi:Tfp pilus assembly protein PilV
VTWIRNQKGFIFIDAMVALVLLGSMLIAIAAAYQYVARNTITNERYNQALALAKREVENLRLGDGAAYVAPTPSTTTIQNTKYNITVDDAITVPDIAVYNDPAHPNRLRPVRFTVTWQDVQNQDSTIELVGYHYE